MRTVGDVTSKIGSGATPRGGQSVYVKDGVALVRSQNVLDLKISDAGLAYIDEDAADALEGVSLQRGDVLINITGDSVARVSLWNRDSRARVNQHVAILRPIPEMADSRYLQYWLAAPRQKEHLLALSAAGASRKALTKEMLSTFPFGPHELPTQQAIAEVLGALDDKIAANERVVEAAEELGRTTAQSFGSKLVPLEEAAKITMGTSPKGADLNEDGVGLPFFQGVRDFGPILPTKRVFTENPVRVAAPGSLLLAVRAPVGKINLAIQETAIGRGLAALETENLATLFFALRAHPRIWDIYAGGGTVFTSVTAQEVRTTLLPLSLPTVAPRLEEKLRPLLDRMTQAELESQTLANTRDELLPLLMNGKITVREAEQQVEEVV